MKIDGGCHCGFIAYEAEADPEMTGVRFRGRYSGQSGHRFLHRICPLMTQNGH
jgi:hypothetical protein